MSKRFWLVIFICAVFVPKVSTAQERVYRSTIKLKGVKWTIRAVAKPVTIYGSWTGELVKFTVRRHGTFAHCMNAEDAGRMMGRMRSNHSESIFQIRPFPKAEPRSWALESFSRLGNTVGYRSMIVTPKIDAGNNEQPPEYFQSLIDHKSGLIEKKSKQGIELWGSYQEWGNGGTSSSAYVPFRKRLNLNGRVTALKLPANFKNWPTELLAEDNYIGFVGIFTAAIKEHSPDLMQEALKERFKGTSDWCRGFGLPHTKAGLQGLIDTMRILVAARKQIEAQVPIDLLRHGVSR